MIPGSNSLAAFYQTPLGCLIKATLYRTLERIAPLKEGQSILAYGHAYPLLETLNIKPEVLIGLVPAALGPYDWPQKALTYQKERAASQAMRINVSCLTIETAFPLPDQSIDYALLLHGLEFSQTSDALLDELYRVLSAQGHLVIFVPNRLGLWSRNDRTPFGYGTPYSTRQIIQLLAKHSYTISHWESALYFPPQTQSLSLRLAPTIEKLGHSWIRHIIRLIAGIQIVVAYKESQKHKPKMARELKAALPRFIPSPLKPRPTFLKNSQPENEKTS